jgi:hypothetical protein
MKKKNQKTPVPCLGFRFTEKEELLIDLHILNSIKFMRKYGKGIQPLREGHPISRR